ncbi:MAG: hypothetical protein R2939_12145 [Kofleriaceae bacterium]
MSTTTESDAAVTQLRAELRQLREEVTALSLDLRRARQHVDLTMRGQLQCRACGCRRIAHAMSVLDRADGASREQLSLYQGSWWRSKTSGQLEAYVCTACGLVEWWVKDPAGLAEHEDYLRIIDGDAGGGAAGPYR